MIAGWLDVRDVAKELGVTVTAVHRLKDRGTIPFQRLGGRVLFRREALDAYLGNSELQARRRGGNIK